ncbi:hypothetical protein JVT61DRAFT_2186 [Boletus reticuloceps]|uniref:Cytidyltransferase-like domain-containing protein n=1 Tax=Boletus reticuloceps TaxID=495285 RepID=A0A8I2YQB4_9AGAM|nr:hypothetical protein JVT61DRAFT_2186 [Boletus reticuloceps]
MTTIRRTLLVASLDDLDIPHHLDPAIAAAATATSDALFIVLLSDAFALTAPTPRTDSWVQVQTLLAHVYVRASKAALQQNNILLDVSVLLNSVLSPDAIPPAIDICFRVHDNISLPDSLSSVPLTLLPSHPRPPPSVTTAQIHTSSLCTRYPVIAMGGTFDHLHAGHKILLSMTAWIATRKVIVGITVDALLKKKSNPHLVESFHTRADKTRSFLVLFRPDLEYDIVDLNNVYGPTGFDPDIQAVVVSKETLSGAAAIDKERASKGLPPLRTFVIDVISSDSSKLDHEDAEILKQTKMSSTFIREWIASNPAHSAR